MEAGIGVMGRWSETCWVELVIERYGMGSVIEGYSRSRRVQYARWKMAAPAEGRRTRRSYDVLLGFASSLLLEKQDLAFIDAHEDHNRMSIRAGQQPTSQRLANALTVLFAERLLRPTCMQL